MHKFVEYYYRCSIFKETIYWEILMKIKKLYKKLFFIALAIYAICVFANQQKTINSYKNAQEYYSEQISSKLAYKDSLYKKKDNINSEEYVEEAAREKLDMYLPNERVYIDTSK